VGRNDDQEHAAEDVPRVSKRRRPSTPRRRNRDRALTWAGSGAPDIVGTTSGTNSGLIAIGTNIRQQSVQLSVSISPGDPAALGRLEEAIRLERLPGRVTSWGRDFAALVGRDDTVTAIRNAVDERRPVSVYGEKKIGKTVLLRHLGPRLGSSFRDGVARLPAGGMLWQDVGQEIVRTFYRSGIAIYLGPAQMQAALAELDALLLLDDVSPEAGIDQLTTILAGATFVLTSPMPLLGGEARIVRLAGLAPTAVADLIRQTLSSLGVSTVSVDLSTAQRIGAALAGHPDRIVTAVHGAHERAVDLMTLMAELDADPQGPVRAVANGLTPQERAVVDAAEALNGAPIGPEHLAAVVPGATLEQIQDLVRRRVLRAASPRFRVDPWLQELDEWRPRPDANWVRDGIRERYVAHFVNWIGTEAKTAGDVAEEGQAIGELLDWAEESGHVRAAHALSIAAEAPLALAGRWGTWSRVTASRLRAAEKLGLHRDAAIALNQIGVQRLGLDDTSGARLAFEQSIERASSARSPDVAAVARHNLAVIDGPPWDPSRDGPSPTNGHDRTFLRSLLVLGLAVVVVGLIVLMIMPRPGLAIEPTSGRFTAAVGVESDGSLFTVTNRGTNVIEGLEAQLTGDGAAQFRVIGGGCLGGRLILDESCTIELGFRPTSADPGFAQLVVTANDGTSITAMLEGSIEADAAASGSAAATATRSPATASTGQPASPDATTPLSLYPDLTISDYVLRGQATLSETNSGETWVIPVKVVVLNEGAVDAGEFAVVVTADGKRVPLQVEGQDVLMTGAPIGAGASLPLVGDVLLDLSYDLNTVRLEVEADSCLDQMDAPPYCAIEEQQEDNNSRELQAIDLEVSDLQLGVPQWPPIGVTQLPVTVPVTFTVTNPGTLRAEQFWLSATVGELQVPLGLGEYEHDQQTGAVVVGPLEPGESLTLQGLVTVPIPSPGPGLEIRAGCAPATDPCLLAEIALGNNSTSAPLPTPSVIVPSPTAAPGTEATLPPVETPTPYIPP
jgi:hypothetical protein